MSCKVEVCERDVHARGLCNPHYVWALRRGFEETPTHKIGSQYSGIAWSDDPSDVDTSKWTRENLAWVAGIVEGEGCISTRNHSKSARITINMTDKDVLEKLKSILDCGSISFKDLSGKNSHQQDQWRYSLNRKELVYAVLVAIYPFLCERRSSMAEEAIAHMGYV